VVEKSPEQIAIETCACHKVRMAARAVTRAYDDALRPAGLRATQMAVLAAIAIDGAISITALAKMMGMDRSTLTRNLRPLEEQALIELGLEGWHRSRTLAISKKGRARLRQAMPLWEKAQKDLKSSLGDTTWSEMHDSLEQVIRAA
jgi:DNA-binding MarR family transcriptional regulator